MDKVTDVAFDAVASFKGRMVAFTWDRAVVSVAREYLEHEGQLLLSGLHIDELVSVILVKVK